MEPIVGKRFTCSQCIGYHICELCEIKNDHPPSHDLLQIKEPKIKD